MSVLENLVLTDGTKLFKTGAFLRAGAGDDDFDMSACDSQHRVLDSTEMARFWLSYLGCAVEEDARVTTSKFFNTTVEFANTYVTDLVDRTQIYESLNTELRSNRRNIVARDFVRDFVPEGLHEHRRRCSRSMDRRSSEAREVCRRDGRPDTGRRMQRGYRSSSHSAPQRSTQSRKEALGKAPLAL